jgi:hypothetical protein
MDSWDAPRGGRNDRTSDNNTSTAWPEGRLLLLAIWWAWTPFFYGLWRLLLLILPGHKKAQHLDQWFMANIWSHGELLWVWLLIGFVGTLVIILMTEHYNDDSSYSAGKLPTRQHTSGATVLMVCLALLCLVGSIVQVSRIGWNTSKDKGRFYDQSVVFHTPSLGQDAPSSLGRLLNHAHQGDGKRCDLVGAADVPSCIKQGSLPTTGWDGRDSSLNGAVYALTHRSGSVQNVSLKKETVNYLNAWRGQPARWSGIMNGSGNGTGMGGVAEWDGSHVTACDFSGPYAIGRSFGGSGLSDLDDKLAETYPGLRFNVSDVWGYCDGNQPIVVVPMTRQTYYANRTVDVAGGIVLIQGNGGQPKLTYVAKPRPGTYPGPVYASSLVDTQLDQSTWAAGRRAQNSFHFGYEPVDSDVQAGNVADYLLRDKATGRLEWVTPLTLRNSSSQQIVAYAVSDADQAVDGQLNPLHIYVLGKSDARVINIDNMESSARYWLTQQLPSLLSAGGGGTLSEFTPMGGNMWRAYVEVKGQLIYLLDFDATQSVSPQLTNVAPDSSSKAPTLNCNHPEQLTTTQVAACIEQLSHYLVTHGSGAGTAPAASASPSPTK